MPLQSSATATTITGITERLRYIEPRLRRVVTFLFEPIHLCPYDPEWPALFAAEGRRILAALSADVAIEHIGSTSVPGIVAMPIIDIMLGVAEPHRDLDSIRTRLPELGYEDMGEAGGPARC